MRILVFSIDLVDKIKLPLPFFINPHFADVTHIIGNFEKSNLEDCSQSKFSGLISLLFEIIPEY